jgi:hypothetical protein
MDRDTTCNFIRRRYANAYGALPEISYSDFGLQAPAGTLKAALGYRRAGQGRLFLETYLDVPIEKALTAVLKEPIHRERIVEIGNLASDTAPAMVQLWAQTANDLAGQADIAVAVLTADLRRMFRRLGLTIYEIASASGARLGADVAQWGAYYHRQPVVCAGFIADGQAHLSKLTDRRAQRRRA